MKRIAFLFVFMIIAFSSLNAKSYPFDMAHSYEDCARRATTIRGKAS